MPAFPGTQLDIPNWQPHTDQDHAENVRVTQEWANRIPVTLLTSTRLAAAAGTITLNLRSDVPFAHLEIYVEAQTTDAANQPLFLRFNGDSAANYDVQFMSSIGAGAPTSTSSLTQTAGRCGIVSASGTTCGGVNKVVLYNYTRLVWQKSYLWQGGVVNGVAQQNETGVGRYSNNTGAITSVLFFPSAGNFTTETSVRVEGLF